MKPLLAALIALSLIAGDSFASSKHTSSLAQQIVGSWHGKRRDRRFHADGKWGVFTDGDDQEDISGRRWHIRGDKLIITFPNDPSKGTMWTAVLRIVSLTPKELVTEEGSVTEVYERMP